jgi:hypothetical protein
MEYNNALEKYNAEAYVILDFALMVILIITTIKGYNYVTGFETDSAIMMEFYLLIFGGPAIVFSIAYTGFLISTNPLRFIHDYEKEVQLKININYDLLFLAYFSFFLIWLPIGIILFTLTLIYGINPKNGYFAAVLFIPMFPVFFYSMYRVNNRNFAPVEHFLYPGERVIFFSSATIQVEMLQRDVESYIREIFGGKRRMIKEWGGGNFYLTDNRIIYIPSLPAKFHDCIDETYIDIRKIRSIINVESRDRFIVNTDENKYLVILKNKEEWQKHLSQHRNIDLSEFDIIDVEL